MKCNKALIIIPPTLLKYDVIIAISALLYSLSAVCLHTIYCKYCNLIGCCTHYLSSDRQSLWGVKSNAFEHPFPIFWTYRKRIKQSFSESNTRQIKLQETVYDISYFKRKIVANCKNTNKQNFLRDFKINCKIIF